MQAEVIEAYEAICTAGKVVYAAVLPPIEDPTVPGESKVLLFGHGGTEAQLPLGRADLALTASMLAVGVMSPGRCVIGWDLKGLFSMFAHRLPARHLEDLKGCRLIDLKYAEAFLGIEAEPPDDLNEAMVRASPRRLGQRCVDFHQAVHVPLCREVLPSIESFGIFDERTGRSGYPWHEVEQVYNGRLRCVESFDRCFNPHTLSDEVKGLIQPPVTGQALLVFDYAHMEPTVLQWLSEDEAMGRILKGGGDPYDAMAAATGLDRDQCKVAFLAVFYGQGTRGLADQLGIDEDLAACFRGTVRQSFPQAWAWLDAVEAMAAAGEEVEDRFGRRRRFEVRPHRARNWAVSSPAAAICLERLVALHRYLQGRGRILFTVHDGYHVLVPWNEERGKVAQGCREVLQGVGGFAPGLSLRCVLKAGRWYDSLDKFGA